MHENDLFAVPSRAVQTFEELTGLNVVVHDLADVIWPFLAPHRFRHSMPLCMAMKASAYGGRCVNFETKRLRRELPEHRSGRVQVCHAGLVEWVVPIFEGARLALVLFAGQRTPGPDFQAHARDPAPKPDPSPWLRNAALPEPVGQTESIRILESLNQLAARLQLWRSELEQSGLGGTVKKKGTRHRQNEVVTRRVLIQRFVFNQHTQPIRLADLASRLHLSESRAGHAVQEACGVNFMDLLTGARVRTAANLLRHSDLPILDIATRSGFGDPSHFHRTFKKKMGTTPLAYRKQSKRRPT